MLKYYNGFYVSEVLSYSVIMGSCSIDISQYRSRIGTFAGQKSPCINKASFKNELKTNTVLESFIILSYLLVMSNVTQKLLIISGLELNPGPSFPIGKEYMIENIYMLEKNSIHIFPYLPFCFPNNAF